jgi:FkbM family methyltransferase
MGKLRRAYTSRTTTVYALALSDNNDKHTFHIDERPGQGALASSIEKLDIYENKMTTPVEVQCMTLDTFCEKTGLIPNFIKLDVEGHELSVINGGWQVIQKHQPIIVFEFWESWWERSVKQIFEMLQPLYRLSRLQDGQNVEEYYYSNKGEGTVDIVCIPRSIQAVEV